MVTISRQRTAITVPHGWGSKAQEAFMVRDHATNTLERHVVKPLAVLDDPSGDASKAKQLLTGTVTRYTNRRRGVR